MPDSENREAVLAALKTLKNLPTLPSIFTALEQIAGNPNAAAQDVAEVISRDPVASSRILRVANSSYYGHKEPAEDLSTAVFRLGIGEIKRIAMSIGTLQVFAKTPNHRFLKELWIHSLSVAVIAGELSKAFNLPNHEQTYLAGLLHDIGKVFFACCFTDEYLIAEAEIRENKGDPLMIETDIIGITHLEAAQRIVIQWKMPPHAGTAIENHHNPLAVAGEDRLLALCIGIANRLARHFAKMENAEESPEFQGWISATRNLAKLDENFTFLSLVETGEPAYSKAQEFSRSL
ncbi:MAG: HDOD domain-containing protein [Verrucomicrobiae bacterium]|nr:HDOD domain-containing protein [Verrucomicrobiae bacterium]